MRKTKKIQLKSLMLDPPQIVVVNLLLYTFRSRGRSSTHCSLREFLISCPLVRFVRFWGPPLIQSYSRYVCLSVCVCVCGFAPRVQFFLALSLAFRSHDQFQASHWSPYAEASWCMKTNFAPDIGRFQHLVVLLHLKMVLLHHKYHIIVKFAI